MSIIGYLQQNIMIIYLKQEKIKRSVVKIINLDKVSYELLRF